MRVGVLALQGCVDPHIHMLEKCGSAAVRVRTPGELEQIDRLIIPGGESTTMLRLLDRAGLAPALREFGKTHPVWGVCAGSILLAKEVRNPEQYSFAFIPIRATRNYYGSQLQSFKASVSLAFSDGPLLVDFIRAPLLESLTPEVQVLGEHDGKQIMLRYGRILATSFHSELGNDIRLHQYFCTI